MRKAVWTLGLMLLVFSSCNQAPIPEQKAPEETTLSAPTTASSVVSSSLNVVVKVKGAPLPSHKISVSGPNGYNVWLTGSTVLTGLIPGTYTVTAGDFIVGWSHPSCRIYSSDPYSQSLVLAASQTATATVTYTWELCGP